MKRPQSDTDSLLCQRVNESFICAPRRETTAAHRRRIFDVAMSSDTEDETGPDEIAELAAFDLNQSPPDPNPLRPSRRLQHVVTASQNVKSDVIWV